MIGDGFFSGVRGKGLFMKQSIVIGLVFASCAVIHAASPTSVCAVVDANAHPAMAEGTPGVFFSEEVLQLEFQVEIVPPINGQHLVELDITNPHGHRYQKLAVPVTADAEEAANPVHLAGYPYPLALRVLRTSESRGRQVQTAVVRLPVAGTLILKNSLYGTWNVQVQLDGVDISCDGGAQFVLLPPGSAPLFSDGFENGGTSRWSSR